MLVGSKIGIGLVNWFSYFGIVNGSKRFGADDANVGWTAGKISINIANAMPMV